MKVLYDDDNFANGQARKLCMPRLLVASFFRNGAGMFNNLRSSSCDTEEEQRNAVKGYMHMLKEILDCDADDFVNIKGE